VSDLRNVETLYVGLDPDSEYLEGGTGSLVSTSWRPVRIVFDPVHYGVIIIDSRAATRGTHGVKKRSDTDRKLDD